MKRPLTQNPGRQWPGRWSQTFSFFHWLLHPITYSLYHLLLHLGRWLLFPKPQFPLLQVENSHHLPAEHQPLYRHAEQRGDSGVAVPLEPALAWETVPQPQCLRSPAVGTWPGRSCGSSAQHQVLAFVPHLGCVLSQAQGPPSLLPGLPSPTGALHADSHTHSHRCRNLMRALPPRLCAPFPLPGHPQGSSSPSSGTTPQFIPSTQLF